MPFQYILANLLAETDQSVGVLFLDENGEAVDVACSTMDPNDMRIVGAYMSIYLRQIERVMESAGSGAPRFLHIESDDLHIHVRPLPEGYFLVLVQKGPSLVGRARRSLSRAAEQLHDELFHHSA